MNRRDAWVDALADPAFMASLNEGLADVAVGRVTSWEVVKGRLVAQRACSFVSPNGRRCIATENEHDGAWAFGHQYDEEPA